MQLRVPAKRSPEKGRSLTRPSRRSGAFDRRLRLEPLEARCLLDGTISGYVRQDVNGDGILQPSDPGAAGFRVYLDANRDGQLQEANGAVDRNQRRRAVHLQQRPPRRLRHRRRRPRRLGPDVADDEVDWVGRVWRRT